MYLKSLLLEEFRRYRHLDLELSPAGLALCGTNASGKSTLLEAIAMLATTRSSRTSTEREVINWLSGQELGFPPFARLLGRVVRQGGEAEIEIALQVDPTGAAPLQKTIRLNGRTVRAMDAVGVLKTVLFTPEDVTLVTGPPGGRRRYLDLMISQIDSRYLRSLARYNRILEQRNSLLKSLAREGGSPSSPAVDAQLAFWDQELVAFGAHLVARRMTVVRRLAGFAATRFAAFGETNALHVIYRPSVGDEAAAAADEGAPSEALEAMVARAFTGRLHELRSDELRRSVSLVGPHRDDVTFTIDGADVAIYGSRGQQRLTVVAAKLAETDLMDAESGERPVVLLDDVLSELDPLRRGQLAESIARLGAQVVITSTDFGLLTTPALASLSRAEVFDGTIRPLSP